MGHKFKTPTELYILLKTLAFPCPAALGSETRFPLCGEEKERIRAFFLSRSALSLFFALFFLRAFALFFLASRARKRKSAKKAPAPNSERSFIAITLLCWMLMTFDHAIKCFK
jgi:hypothetical protein